MSSRLAIDIGGTFTDVALECNGQTHTKKVLTSHAQPAEAVLQGTAAILREQAIDPASISLVLHGTTLATNAIIERRGAKSAFLTTAGHRDVLAMAYENRFEQYDVNIERPEPLISRRLRLPIYERMSGTGETLRPLSIESVDAAIEVLKREKIESVAIGFLHAYANGAHEEATAERVATKLPGIAICFSSQVCPEIREYERFSTTCANAYVLPLMSSYLNDLAARLRMIGCKCPFMVMTSNGGLTSLAMATKFPIRLVESGPAGGAVMASWKARELGVEHALSFDMGGTTAKICLIDGGAPLRSRAFEVDRRYRFKKGSGLPVRIPVIEMVEIGAGGGSIASIDRMQRLRVGPQSAGSQPGPACYGLGGVEPTVTDSDVVIGRLEPSRFAGKELVLQVEAAKEAIGTTIHSESSDWHDGARAIAEIVDENMASAARGHASEWGKAVADRVLIAYGGAAPIHAARLLEKLQCDYALIPVGAGVGSALGFLRSPVAYEVVHSRYMRLSAYDQSFIDDVLTTMRTEAETALTGTADLQDVIATATAFMRYVGQGYEISVPFDLEELSKEQFRTNFETAYETLYGRLLPKADIEIMSWTLTLATPVPEPIRITKQYEARPYDQAYREQTMIELQAVLNARCIDREKLSPGDQVNGPALITEPHTTTVVPSDFCVRVNHALDLMLQRTVR